VPSISLIHQDFHISFCHPRAAFLAVTGGEAMYCEHGPFRPGADPARMVRRGASRLVLNYFGQAALLVADPAHWRIRFYQLAPDWLHYPLVAFATVATVIASQAIISGVFSLTQQSIQLGFLPRMQIKHTTSHAIGQILCAAGETGCWRRQRSEPSSVSAHRMRLRAPTASPCRC